MSKLLKEKIICNEQLAPGIFSMLIESEYISSNAKPGQFINIKCSDGLNALLRRPVSICSVNADSGIFNIVYQVKGTGTQYLSQKTAGSTIDIMGPLGNTFDLSESCRNVAVVGGGIGIFPLLFLLHKKKAAYKSAFLGFRSKEYIVLKNQFESVSDKLHISTDDGSSGYKGLVTDLLIEDMKQTRYDVIYTCGPLPMIKKVVEVANENGLRCQVSMEQRMACGIGACLVCACKTKDQNGWKYSHVCKDGPVFWSDEVMLDE